MSSNTVNLLHSISSYILVIGVLLTLVGTVGQIWTGRLKEQRQQAEVARAHASANESIERARSAEKQLDRLQRPREIPAAIRQQAIARLSKYASQEFAGVLASSGFDVRPFWVDVDDLLREAGWARVEPAGLSSGSPPAGIAIEATPGVQVTFDPRFTEGIEQVAVDLASVLNDSGVDAVTQYGRDDKENREHVITVRVGPKPV